MSSKHYISVFIFAFLTLSRCAPATTKYMKKHTVPGEIVWAYDGKIKAVKDGMVVFKPNDLSRLPEAVACVPDAKTLADSANSKSSSGSTMLWSGIGILIGGSVVGSVMIISASSKGNEVASGAVYGGVGVIAGSLTIGTILTGIGKNRIEDAKIEAIDAVNIYNSRFMHEPKCRQR